MQLTYKRWAIEEIGKVDKAKIQFCGAPRTLMNMKFHTDTKT